MLPILRPRPGRTPGAVAASLGRHPLLVGGEAGSVQDAADGWRVVGAAEATEESEVHRSAGRDGAVPRGVGDRHRVAGLAVGAVPHLADLLAVREGHGHLPAVGSAAAGVGDRYLALEPAGPLVAQLVAGATAPRAGRGCRCWGWGRGRWWCSRGRCWGRGRWWRGRPGVTDAVPNPHTGLLELGRANERTVGTGAGLEDRAGSEVVRPVPVDPTDPLLRHQVHVALRHGEVVATVAGVGLGAPFS